METDTILVENLDKDMQCINSQWLLRNEIKQLIWGTCAHFNAEKQYGTICMNRNKRNKNNQDNLTNKYTIKYF